MLIRGKNVKLGRMFVFLLIVAAVLVAIFKGNTILSALKGENARVVALNQWSGFAPIIWANNGMVVDPTSHNAMDFDLKVQFQREDNRSAAVTAFATKKVDAIWCTVDMLSCETSTSPMSDLMRAGGTLVLINDRSNGADVVVVNRTIHTVQDFKGKKVAFTPASASHSVLLKLLASADMTMDDIIPVYTNSGIEAADFFKSGDVPIAVVWSPDDADCLNDVGGSYRFFSTEKAKNVVYDGLMVRKEDLQDKAFREWVTKLAKAWLTANAECTSSDAKKQEAANVFATHFGLPADIVLDGLNKVRLTTYEDNRNLFGLNPMFKGVTAQDAYTSMARIYTTIRDEKGSYFSVNPASWNAVADASIIAGITDLTGVAQAAEPDVIQFTPVTAEQEQEMAVTPPITSVKVIINFPINSAKLTDEAMTIIDREVVPYTKEFSGYRMRCDGHTDQSTGTDAYNRQLSYERALAVQNYLIKTCGFDRNRFLTPIGWGSSKPLYPVERSEQDRAANRRTEFSFINE